MEKIKKFKTELLYAHHKQHSSPITSETIQKKNPSVTSTTIHVEALHIITAFHIQEATINLHGFQHKPTATYAIEKINQLIKCTQLLTHITHSSANIILTSNHHTFTSEKPNMNTSSSTTSTGVKSHSYKVYILQCIIFLFKLLTLANLLFMQIRYPIVRPPAIMQFRVAFHNNQVIV